MKRIFKTFFVLFTCFFVSFVPPLANIAEAKQIDISGHMAFWPFDSAETEEEKKAAEAQEKGAEGESHLRGAIGDNSGAIGSATTKIGTRECTIDGASIGNGAVDVLLSGVSLLVANVLLSTLNQLPFVGGAFEPFDDALDQFNGVWTNAVIYGIIGSVAVYAGAVLVNLGLLINSNIDAAANPIIKTGFNVTLGITNIFFIIVLVVIGIMTILRRSNWSAQKRLGNLIIAIVLVNFSIYIASLLINVSNIFTVAIGQNFCASDLFNALHLGATYAAVKSAIGASAFSSFLIAPAAMVAASAITIIGALTLIALFLFLVIRYVVIILMLSIMPIAWIGFVAPDFKIPGVGNPWQAWWSQFTKWLFVGPIITFCLYLTIAVLNGMTEATGTGTLTGIAGGMMGILNIFAALIMSVAGIYVAIKGSGFAGALIAAGMASGAGFVASKVSKTVGGAGFRQQSKLQQKAEDLRKQADQETDIKKAQDLRNKAERAEKFGKKAFGSVGSGAAMGFGGVVASKALGSAGVKIQAPKGPTTVAEWKEETIKKAEERYKGMTESQKKEEMRQLAEDMDKATLVPGRKIELQNRYTALAQGMAKDGKLDTKMIGRVMTEDMQKQFAVMGVKIDMKPTIGKLNPDDAAKTFKAINEASQSASGGTLTTKAAISAQVDIMENLQKGKNLTSIKDTNSLKSVYSADVVKEVEKRGGSGSFEKYEQGFGMEKAQGKIITESHDKIQDLDRRISAATTERASSTDASRIAQLTTEIATMTTDRTTADTALKTAVQNNAEWVSKLESKDLKNLPLDKIFGDPSDAANSLFGGDAQSVKDMRKAVINEMIKTSPQNATQLLNVKTENYESAAREVFAGLNTALSSDPTNVVLQGQIKTVRNNAKKRGIIV